MTCAGCAATVQRAIEDAPGVQDASVSFTDASAVVSGTGLKSENLIQLIEAKGYSASAITQAAAPSELLSEIELRQARSERQWRFRASVGLGIWIPLALLHWLSDAEVVPWAMLAGSTVVLATAGAGFYRSAFAAALKRTTNMDTLISIGATAAYVFSLVIFIAGLLGRELLDPIGQPLPLYFGESAALLGIISLGHWLEARATAKAGSAVRELLKLQPDEALTIDEAGSIMPIASADVKPGDRILIRPGDRIPVDGIVVGGESDVDESVVTGESLPVPKARGDVVVAGSLNDVGRLVVECSIDGRHSTVARIAELVQRAQASKANVQRLADRVCAVFVPAVLTIAAATLLGWWAFGNPAAGVIAMVTVLIISCPCALGLATPMAVMVGTGAAGRKGILIKSAHALELAGRAHTVVFDKTGTLTSGEPVVTRVDMADAANADEAELLKLAASVEAVSEHPIARAIVQATVNRDIELRPVSNFLAVPGEGVQGVVDGREVHVLRDEYSSCRIVVDGITLGTLLIADSIRPDAPAAIGDLRAMGITVKMLSGDRKETAYSVGRQLDLTSDEVTGEATPETKLQLIRDLGPGAVMIGDGINDAAALAQADLGIAMASGTNIAIESADVVIPGDHVQAVPQTIWIARETLKTIKQNLFFAFVYNAAMIPIAALVYLGGAYAALNYMGYGQFLPGAVLLIWFLAFLTTAIFMFGSMFLAVGAACSDQREAQSALLPIWVIICIPLFALRIMLEDPSSSIASTLSLFPLATPLLMPLRLSADPGLAYWQPFVGMALVLLTTVICVWAAGRVFRVGILTQGKGYSISQVARWIISG